MLCFIFLNKCLTLQSFYYKLSYMWLLKHIVLSPILTIPDWCLGTSRMMIWEEPCQTRKTTAAAPQKFRLIRNEPCYSRSIQQPALNVLKYLIQPRDTRKNIQISGMNLACPVQCRFTLLQGRVSTVAVS